MLDLLSGERTERTGLEMVRTRPMPFPPEPFAWAGIELTKRSLARADSQGVGAICGCAPWTGWGSASTADPGPGDTGHHVTQFTFDRWSRLA